LILSKGMSELISATRYALTGIVIGSLVSAGGDVVFEYAMTNMGPMPSTTTPGSAYGRGLFALFLGSGVIAGSLLVGDKIIDALNASVEDPLFRIVYYTTTLAQSRTAMQAAGMTRGLVQRFAPSASAPAPTKLTSSVAPSCASGSCSQ
jgi:hypothetical protein